MLKELHNATTITKIPMNQMLPGQIARITDPRCYYRGQLVIRNVSVHHWEVMLMDGSDYWQVPLDIVVELLPVGTKITFEVTS